MLLLCTYFYSLIRIFLLRCCHFIWCTFLWGHLAMCSVSKYKIPKFRRPLSKWILIRERIVPKSIAKLLWIKLWQIEATQSALHDTHYFSPKKPLENLGSHLKTSAACLLLQDAPFEKCGLQKGVYSDEWYADMVLLWNVLYGETNA